MGDLLYVVVFVAGLVGGSVGEYYFARNNPKIIKGLEDQVGELKSEAFKYRQAYEGLRAKIKEKAEGK